ncbi:MAG: hypothetical protein RIQ98_999 [Bacteroidota bacterium]
MKRLFFLWLLSIAFGGSAQIYTYPMLAKQYSTSYATGTSRMQGLGGTHSVLGADLSSIAGNAAGLGFYSRSEIGINVAHLSTNTESMYLDQKSTSDNSMIHMPNFGIVLSGEYLSSSSWRGAFGIGYSRQVVLMQPLSIDGTNNRSSYLDYLIQKAGDKGATGATLDEEYDSYYNTADSPEAAAYQAYLINPNAKTGGAPFERYLPNLPTNQSGTAVNNGSIAQWDISYGAAYQDRLFIGLGLHFAKLRTTMTQLWEERYPDNNFVAGWAMEEQLNTTGSGVSISLGTIYKLKPNLRVALNLQTPTYFDQLIEQYAGTLSPQVSSIPVSGGFITRVKPVKLTPNEFSYQLATPFRLSGGLAYFFGKRGLLSADIEMVNYSGMYVASAELGPYANQQFKDKYNTQMSRNFQTALNMKVGAEFRLTPSWTLRGGVASYGNGFSNTYDSIDRSQFQLSGGLGYRSSTYYVDLAFVQRSGKDAYTPYTLKNAADYASAALNITQTQISLGGGLFF